MTNTKPVVGQGGTHQVGTDAYPYTIIEVSESGKTIKAQRDEYIRTDSNGQSELQTYEYSPDLEGVINTFTLRKSGNYHEKGQSRHYHPFFPGHRRFFRDPSF